MNWKILVGLLLIITMWSASYEAVNWKTFSERSHERAKGQPRMRLWIERCYFMRFSAVNPGQPRMRLWIERIPPIISSTRRNGQPRMRLWIERLCKIRKDCRDWVSLVWGCELKDHLSFPVEHPPGSASYEAVNWKRFDTFIDFHCHRSASYEAVNWKVQCHSPSL